MSISIGVPLSIPGVGKDHLFNQLGGGYKIITDNDPIDLRYGNDQYVKRQRNINDNKFWNNVEEAIKYWKQAKEVGDSSDKIYEKINSGAYIE